ncbi:MAG: MATE family efflux transporter [Pseudomonadota bacterium]
MTEENRLTTRPIPRLVREIAIPSTVGYFFHTMYNVVDTYFGGLISTQALAALSLSLPVFFIIIAVAMGLSTGTTALIANALGSGDRKGAELLAAQGITFGIVVSFFLTLFGISVSPLLFSLLGANDEYLGAALIYMDTLFLGSVFFVLLHMLNSVLNASGNTRPYRNFLIAGFFLNIIMDPWFIYGGLGVPPLKILGIALATVLIQVFGCIYLGFEVYRAGFISKNGMKKLQPKMRPFREIAAQGFPSSINTITVGMGIFVITYFISQFGKEAVAAYGAAMRVEQMVLVPTMGLHIATLSIVAQNNGAGLVQRVRETLNCVLKYGGILMALGTVAVFVAAPYLMKFFSKEARVIDVGTVYLRIDAFVLYAYVILFTHVAALQGIKRPFYALWIGLGRQIVVPFILFTLFTRALDFGLLSIWWGIFSITWSAAVFTLFYARRIMERTFRVSPGDSAGDTDGG